MSSLDDKPVRGTTPQAVHAETSVPSSPTLTEAPASVPSDDPKPPVPPPTDDPVDALFKNAPELLDQKEDPGQVNKLARLLPLQNLELTTAETEELSVFMEARAVLGPASAAVLICSELCPFRTRCPLYRVHKAPFGSRCPFETSYVTERFGCWMRDLGVTEVTMTETERLAVSSLVVLDIQELRVLSILSDASRAHMTSRVVRDVDIETGMPLAYEDVVAPETQLRRDIHEQRSRILNDFNLTPAAKVKAARVLALRKGADMASRQSAAADLIRTVNAVSVEVEPNK